ncbi:DNA mismatch repair protein msh6 [Myotisia sp. PD_48]|nr:DNA mismatch repair protein msh6 [Myotisia sp. PD_48]
MAPMSSRTPSTPRVLKGSTPNTQNMKKQQQSILGFFQPKSSPSASSPSQQNNPSQGPDSSPVQRHVVRKSSTVTSTSRFQPKPKLSSRNTFTPDPSSDAIEPENENVSCSSTGLKESAQKQVGQLSPVTPTNGLTELQAAPKREYGSTTSTRQAKAVVKSYCESDDDDIVGPAQRRAGNKGQKKRKVSIEGSDDEFEQYDTGDDYLDIDDFVVPDDSDEDARPTKKRKRPSNPPSTKLRSSSPDLGEETDSSIGNSPTTSGTAKKWSYDPSNNMPYEPRTQLAKSVSKRELKREKVHMIEPEKRYPWLANAMDMDKNPVGHPDYDPRTLYIPPIAWSKFSAFEKQYWEIKQKFWDTVVFFKKGKFYELYENDATIGHQLFDLKLTDRVNMRMVGVPEMSLDHWANQFVAKGFKIARVDQSESALGKEMRERGNGKPQKEDKIIKRELKCVLTAGTLVDGSMIQNDMSTYCVAIKEALIDGLPAFGISFVDTATGQFYLSEFSDDVDLTKFETFVAQTRPQELLLEKSVMSTKALRILKNNVGPTTLWNHLKPGKEFWEADMTVRELDASKYFESEDVADLEAWPKVLRASRDKELVMSAFGALLQYLRMLQIERDIITIGNFAWYDPIEKASSLVLDGQTLINLEIFANSYDGGPDGTLFQLLNRCITPFGKRMFKQWVCHPLMDVNKINARLDAVESLNADNTIHDQFSSKLSKMPDLERLISRVHAGSCKVQEFIRVLEGFEQIEETVGLIKQAGSGDGLIGQLIASMPDLSEHLKYWETAFDRRKAKEAGILVPEEGVEEDFDTSQQTIDDLEDQLQQLLQGVRKDLKCSSIVFRDSGKEIYQLEVPVKVKGIPKNWNQMSATKQVKRYYFPQLRTLIRELQEAQETHSQIVKDVTGRFYARFDETYQIWLTAVKIIAQLDCLLSLAKASSALGYPSCRPILVDDKRSVLEFRELRHPCMMPNVGDFIPNDVILGGESPNMNLLTGANAAGKSTVLRMTCTAVIMAQLGCYVPCEYARLTPVDRVMSRLGANDNIFAAQSTFFVELSETKKILSEATPRSLVILDELGRGTSSYDGVAVAQAVLHHVATHVGALGFFATHYHSLAAEFEGHPEIAARRMRIDVDDSERRITFLYKLEEGVAKGSFGMHCASMCGIPSTVVETAEVAAKQWEHTSRMKDSLEKRKGGGMIGLGWWSDVAWILKDDPENPGTTDHGIEVLLKAIESL